MINITKILYPTDFSKSSLAALPYARSFAQQFGAELHCLHVVDEAYQYWMAGADNAIPVVISESEIVDAAREQLEKFVDKNMAQEKESLTMQLVSGRPFVEIIRYARDQQIDLIVIATHGHGALASMLMGNVAEKVVRKAPCPVLTVRDSEHKFEMP